MDIPACEAATCVPARNVLYDYAAEMSDPPQTVTVLGQGNTWRVYDPENRAHDAQDVARLVRTDPAFGKATQVVLKVSWSGSAPAGYEAWGAPLASMSSELGVPTAGAGGFVWFGPKGQTMITQQDFTGLTVPYQAKPGDWVMVSAALAVSEAAMQEAETSQDTDLLFAAAQSEDVFGLHPENALRLYERGAALGDGLAAYNAAMIRFQRDWDGDREAAKALLDRAEKLGDKKAAELRARIAD